MRRLGAMVPGSGSSPADDNDFTHRFPLAVAWSVRWRAAPFLIDGEAIVTNGDGLAVFDLIRRARHGDKAVLCVFDLIS